MLLFLEKKLRFLFIRRKQTTIRMMITIKSSTIATPVAMAAPDTTNRI
jgi:hypothetical protein